MVAVLETGHARRVRFQRFARLSIFLPYAVPTVIASLLWGFLYLPTVSPFPEILRLVGLSMPNLFSTNVVLLSVAGLCINAGLGALEAWALRRHS